MESKVNKAFDKETSFKTLDVVNSWITATDNKASILLAFVGIVIGLSTNAYSKVYNLLINSSVFGLIFILFFSVIYLTVLGLVIYHFVSVFRPRIKSEQQVKDNLVSFIEIANLTETDYLKYSMKVDNRQLNEMILSQINVNSKIAVVKVKHFNRALVFGVALIPLTMVLMLITG